MNMDRMQAMVLPLVLAGLTGCATMTTMGKQEVKIDSAPPGATIYVDGKPAGITPATLAIPRKSATMVRLSLDGYRDGFVKMKGSIEDPLVILDFIAFILPGLVDLGSGAAYHLRPESVNATLDRAEGASTLTSWQGGGGGGRSNVSVPRGRYSSIAVAELDAQGVSSTDAAVITEMLRNRLVNRGGFTVIEKKNMDKVLSEQAFQQTGCTSAECAVKLGKLLNVRGMVVGTFGRLLGRYVVGIRVVDVETGQAVMAEEAKGDSVDQIEGSVNTMVARMSSSLR